MKKKVLLLVLAAFRVQYRVVVHVFGVGGKS
jgi:hypothetical protein